MMSVSITGIPAIDKALKALPETVQHRVLSAAHYAAAKPVVEKEKSLVPVDRGVLRDSIGAVKLSQRRATSIGEVIVGPRRTGASKGFHGHLVEFGSKLRKTKKGADRGYMPKHPFAKPAFDQTKSQVINSIGTQIGRAMVRTMRKYIK